MAHLKTSAYLTDTPSETPWRNSELTGAARRLSARSQAAGGRSAPYTSDTADRTRR